MIPSTGSLVKTFVHCARVIAKDLQGVPSPHYINGILNFTEGTEKEDGCYQYIFGPVAYNSGIILARNNANMVGGLTRLTGIREPNRLGYHDHLRANQELFELRNVFFDELIKKISHEVKFYFDGWLDDPEVRMEIAATNPKHAKYKIRVPAWFEDVQRDSQIKHKTWITRNNGYVLIKMKGREIAKPKKYIRITYDLGTPASLAVGDFVERIKTVIADMGIIMGSQFVKSPDLAALTEVFENLINPQGQVYFPYFSDDSCISIRCIDGIYRANVDISTCDASHTRAVFNALRKMCSGNRELEKSIERAIKQCETDLLIRSVANKKEKVTFSVTEPVLYTGSILTTLINNIANMMIYSAIRTKLAVYTEITMSQCKDLIVSASELAGYIVTIFECKNIQQLQFLKHSPCWSVSGRLVPVLNPGVIARTIGRCWGDLPTYGLISFIDKFFGRKRMTERMTEYNRRQTSCFKRGPRHSLMTVLVDRFQPGVEVNESGVNEIDGDLSHEVVSDEQMALRYDISASDFREFADAYKCGFNAIKTAASMAIMQLDYGL